MPNDFIPKSKAKYNAWLRQLQNGIPIVGPQFGLPSGEITTVTNATAAQLTLADASFAAKAALKAALRAEADGQKTTDALLRKKFGQWKVMPLFTIAHGKELSILSPAADFDPHTYKPRFKVRIIAGVIHLDWIKRGVDRVNVYARLAGQSAWTLIGTDTRTPYFDTRPLAQPHVPEVREYMLRGLIKDTEIGLDSNIVSITWAGA